LVLTKHLDIAEFFEGVVEKGVDARFALPWATVELLRFLNYNKATLDSVDIKLEHFVELLNAVKKGEVTPLQAKEILNEFYPRSFSVKGRVKKEGKISGVKELEKVAKEVIAGNSKAVKDYKGGDKNAFNFLMGKVMEKTQSRADFVIARSVLERLLR
jgi:aspartyl-tRNA(Asn)/glutamyl-tRNA(Gln) amidotransferase subunit B